LPFETPRPTRLHPFDRPRGGSKAEDTLSDGRARDQHKTATGRLPQHRPDRAGRLRAQQPHSVRASGQSPADRMLIGRLFHTRRHRARLGVNFTQNSPVNAAPHRTDHSLQPRSGRVVGPQPTQPLNRPACTSPELKGRPARPTQRDPNPPATATALVRRRRDSCRPPPTPYRKTAHKAKEDQQTGKNQTRNATKRSRVQQEGGWKTKERNRRPGESDNNRAASADSTGSEPSRCYTPRLLPKTTREETWGTKTRITAWRARKRRGLAYRLGPL